MNENLLFFIGSSLVFIFGMALFFLKIEERAEKRHEALLQYTFRGLEKLDPDVEIPTPRVINPTRKPRKAIGVSKKDRMEEIRTGKKIDPFD